MSGNWFPVRLETLDDLVLAVVDNLACVSGYRPPATLQYLYAPHSFTEEDVQAAVAVAMLKGWLTYYGTSLTASGAGEIAVSEAVHKGVEHVPW